jgi:xanthine dehydrogenase accessory factor
MRDILAEVTRWLQADDPVAVATVVSTWGSAPRPAGSRMAVSRSGGIAGSVSGGCLEGDIYEQAQEVLAGAPPRLLHYGVSDDLAWSVGLSCGGEVDILLEPLGPLHRELLVALEQERPVVLVSRLSGTPGADRLVPASDTEAAVLLDSETPARRDGWFFEPFPRQPELLIVGGSHIAIPLTKLATELGFAVTVIDARAKFADRARFPAARRVIHSWPDEALASQVIDRSTYIVVLTHDPKFDDPAITAALHGNARYVGAIGSKKTHRERLARLRQAGLRPEALERVHAPIGLDLGAQTAEETALAILAEMVAARHGRAGGVMSVSAAALTA